MSNEDISRRLGLEGGEFYLTAPAPCPYLKGEMERKVFSYLGGDNAPAINSLLTSRAVSAVPRTLFICRLAMNASLAFRCALWSEEFAPTKSRKRILNRNTDLIRRLRKPASNVRTVLGLARLSRRTPWRRRHGRYDGSRLRLHGGGNVGRYGDRGIFRCRRPRRGASWSPVRSRTGSLTASPWSTAFLNRMSLHAASAST